MPNAYKTKTKTFLFTELTFLGRKSCCKDFLAQSLLQILKIPPRYGESSVSAHPILKAL